MIDNKIEAKEIVVKDLFDSKFLFRVPGYQRPFRWEEDNFDQLFEDIEQAMEREEDNYFLGSIVLQAREIKLDSSGVYDVVDGQQRLTTLTILLSVMRDLSNNTKAKLTLQEKIYQEENEYEGTKEEVRLEVRDKEKNFFRKYVLEEEGTKKSCDKSNLSEPQQRMMLAIEIFRNKFTQNGSLNQELLKNMIKYLLNNCILIYVKTGNFTSAYRLFSVLNNRGIPLETSDLLKSHNLGEVDEQKRKQYEDIWENIEEDLGRSELDKLIGFIRTMVVKDRQEKTMIEEYNTIVFPKKLDAGEKFVQYLQQVSRIYQDKVVEADLGNSHPDAVKYHNLMSIMRDYVPFSDWITTLLSYVIKFGSKNKIYGFLRKIESFYIVNWILGITSTKREIENIKILHIIDNAKNEEEVISSNFFNVSGHRENVQKALSADDFYNKKYAKYLLLRVDMSLSENSNIEKTYKGTISVEHILPQNPKKDDYWTKKFSESDRIKYTNMLGNLVLLSRKKNSSANNRPFPEKLNSYYSKGITDFEITKEIRDYNEWVVTSIETRQNQLESRLVEFLIGSKMG